MKTYEVSFKYEVWASFTVDAQDETQAENLALEMLQADSGECLNYGDWTDTIVEEITPPLKPLTPDQIAFVDAYCLAVCDAPRDIVEAFIREDDGDKFSEEYGLEYYSGLADAHNMWDLALQFSKKATA